MRRYVLHITAALLAFTVGFLTVGKFEHLSLALPLALCVFIFAKIIPDLKFKLPSDFDSHSLKVVTFTILLWIPLFAIYLPLIPQNGLSHCEPDYIDFESVRTTEKAVRSSNPAEPVTTVTLSSESCSCDGKLSVKPKALVYAGVVNEKAVSKPAPIYPAIAKSACSKGTVTVSIITDTGTGEVLWADAVSGHPLLRKAARDAACKARFHATLISGKPIMVRGILTYNFTL